MSPRNHLQILRWTSWLAVFARRKYCPVHLWANVARLTKSFATQSPLVVTFVIWRSCGTLNLEILWLTDSRKRRRTRKEQGSWKGDVPKLEIATRDLPLRWTSSDHLTDTSALLRQTFSIKRKLLKLRKMQFFWNPPCVRQMEMHYLSSRLNLCLAIYHACLIKYTFIDFSLKSRENTKKNRRR